eukprot:TRINITY_DN3052_c0_g2_i2.p1 TRINITY_DN3052_c0_g2~~TRINITY_DN3052_c0_g2_i2.p1  ORF type:complete len:532 (+),score=58.25 TRINITY_DN3052_c0_g2_i2:809-2404(+)
MCVEETCYDNNLNLEPPRLQHTAIGSGGAIKKISGSNRGDGRFTVVTSNGLEVWTIDEKGANTSLKVSIEFSKTGLPKDLACYQSSLFGLDQIATLCTSTERKTETYLVIYTFKGEIKLIQRLYDVDPAISLQTGGEFIFLQFSYKVDVRKVDYEKKDPLIMVTSLEAGSLYANTSSITITAFDATGLTANDGLWAVALFDSKSERIFAVVQTTQTRLIVSFDPDVIVSDVYPQTNFQVNDLKIYANAPDNTTLCQLAIATARHNHFVYSLKNSYNAKIDVMVDTYAMRYSIGEAVLLLPGSSNPSESFGVVYRSTPEDWETESFTYVIYKRGNWNDREGIYAVGEYEIFSGPWGRDHSFISGLTYFPSTNSDFIALMGVDKGDTTSMLQLIVNVSPKFKVELKNSKAGALVDLYGENRIYDGLIQIRHPVGGSSLKWIIIGVIVVLVIIVIGIGIRYMKKKRDEREKSKNQLLGNEQLDIQQYCCLVLNQLLRQVYVSVKTCICFVRIQSIFLKIPHTCEPDVCCLHEYR